MAESAASPPVPSTEEERVLLEWSVWLGRSHPKKQLIAALVIAAASVLSFYTFGPLFGVLALLLLFGSVSELFLPVRYQLTTRKAVRRSFGSLVEMEWPRVKKLLYGPDGIKISPFASPSRLEAFRGIYLRFLPENREEGVRLVKELAGSEGN